MKKCAKCGECKEDTHPFYCDEDNKTDHQWVDQEPRKIGVLADEPFRLYVSDKEHPKADDRPWWMDEFDERFGLEYPFDNPLSCSARIKSFISKTVSESLRRAAERERKKFAILGTLYGKDLCIYDADKDTLSHAAEYLRDIDKMFSSRDRMDKLKILTEPKG